jgi:hypothetical protein
MKIPFLSSKLMVPERLDAHGMRNELKASEQSRKSARALTEIIINMERWLSQTSLGRKIEARRGVSFRQRPHHRGQIHRSEQKQRAGHEA